MFDDEDAKFDELDDGEDAWFGEEEDEDDDEESDDYCEHGISLDRYCMICSNGNEEDDNDFEDDDD